MSGFQTRSALTLILAKPVSDAFQRRRLSVHICVHRHVTVRVQGGPEENYTQFNAPSLWRLKLRDMNQRHKNAEVEIATQTSVDSPNHIYCNCNYGGIFMRSCAKPKCIGCSLTFFYLVQYLLSYTMP